MKLFSPFVAMLGAALIFSSAVSADSNRDRGGRYEYPRHVKMPNNHVHITNRHHSGGNWIVPMVIGGVLGYTLAAPREESVTYVQSNPAPVVYSPQPIYQEQWVYFSDCDCQRRVLVKIR